MSTPLRSVSVRTDVTRVLVVTAHPDDVDFGAAGTVATWTEAGIETAYCMCTSGDAGGFDDTPRDEIPRLCARPSSVPPRSRGRRVRRPVPRLPRRPRSRPSLELRRDISREIRRFRPHRVLAPSPEIWWRRIPASHPDHRAVGEAALAAVYPDARNPFAHPELLADEGLEPWSVRELWLMAAPDERIDHVVDITDTVGRKVAALRAHASQTTHMTDLDQRIRSLGGMWAHRFGLTAGRLAEAFQIVSID